MRFRQQEEQARTATAWLLLLFGLTVLFTVVAVNLALALVWKLQAGWRPGYPLGFFETNTVVTLGFVLGGTWLESMRLRDGGAHVAMLIGGREIETPANHAEQRLRNVVDEMGIASGLKPPRLFVLDREQAINALAAGWEPQDSVIAVTAGSLQRLNRDEMQGVVAHEFAHIINGDTRLNMRLIGMVFGLQMIFNLGRALMAPDEQGQRGPGVVIGLPLVAAGSIGWLAGRLLKAGVSRQREYLADAYAVQYTRQPSGIGDALRKIATQLERGERLQHVNAEVVSPLLLSSDTLQKAGLLATHPTIDQRLRRIFGRSLPPLPDDPIAEVEKKAQELTPLELPAPAAGAAAFAATAADPSEQVARNVAQQALLEISPQTTPPAQLKAAVLACLLPASVNSGAEFDTWRQCAGDAPAAWQLLKEVQSLPPRQRQPWFERLLGYAAALPCDERNALERTALALVQADGRLLPQEYLGIQVLHRMLSATPDRAASTGRLQLEDLAAPVAAVTQALASLLPAADRLRWIQTVLRGLGLPAAQETVLPSVSELNQAMSRLTQVDPMHSPAMAKSWTQAMGAAAAPQSMADALRCLCLLIDTPLPPQLADRFDTLPPPR